MSNQTSLKQQNKGILQLMKDSKVKDQKDLHSLSQPQPDLKAIYKRECNGQHPHSGYESIKFHN
ncbi:hypothetical protein LCM10_04015 [Rossellomorea aquimaris]|uniref:hypothetical protein n=1 Tax=Rossellomorea aquimaris TaxID=189382 RepID=UPI001CD4F9ED|nr:hypothetical protein [Rossellomorea aquimaris]MCA1054142.1 hypothetical protein [Rossellomorea aquimaris]